MTERGTTALLVEAMRELRAEKADEISALRAEKDAEIAAQRQELASQRAEIDKLQARLERIEKLLSADTKPQARRRPMKHKTAITICSLIVLLLAPGAATIADLYSIDWFTTDSGGAMSSTGGPYELSGTVGQPDAAATVMTGGIFELAGGFWTVPPCWYLSDINNDGLRDGMDVSDFIGCIVAGGANCACADLDINGLLDVDDIAVFVNDLLAGGASP